MRMRYFILESLVYIDMHRQRLTLRTVQMSTGGLSIMFEIVRRRRHRLLYLFFQPATTTRKEKKEENKKQQLRSEIK